MSGVGLLALGLEIQNRVSASGSCTVGVANGVWLKVDFECFYLEGEGGHGALSTRRYREKGLKYCGKMSEPQKSTEIYRRCFQPAVAAA